MPTYDYRCTSCRHRFELRQSFTDEPGADCPVCGAQSERLVTAVAVHFKGTGFYKTDYASNRSRTNGASADSEKPDGGEKKKSESAEKKQAGSSKGEKSASASSTKSASDSS